jgi:predicted permease
MNDFRFALRLLGKSPVFTFLALLTLSVGVGLNSAIFSLIHSLFLQGLPFRDSTRIVRVYGEARERDLRRLPFSVPKFLHFRDGQNVFSSIAADTGASFTLTGMGEPFQLFGCKVTANYFDLLGVRPTRGRNFLPEEEMKEDVALVTESFWHRYFNSDSMVLGRSITLNGVATTIVGVLPNLPISWFGRGSEIFTVKPFELRGTPQERLMRGVSFMRCIGRLKAGITVKQAQAALAALDRSYHEQQPENNDNWSSVLISGSEDVTGNLRSAFIVLSGAVIAVLIIACSNVTNLLLIRFTSRRREIAVRIALGAERRGIVRLFMLESMLLSAGAAGVGLCLAVWITWLVPRMAGDKVPLESRVALDWPLLLFTLAISLLGGLAVGLYPAWQTSQTAVVDGLKEGGRGLSAGIRQQHFRWALIGGQVGLSVVLLAGAAMLVSSFVRLSGQQPGFRSEGVWVAGITLPTARYPDAAARALFAGRLLAELQTSPGVEAVSAGDSVPLSGNASSTPYALTNEEAAPVNQRPLGLTCSILPHYFLTLGIPLISGRDFTERDEIDQPEVAILSKSTAKKLFAGEDPIGRQILLGSDNLPAEIVGVVGDVRSQHLAKLSDVEFYRPWAQRPSASLVIAVRSAIKPETTARVVRAGLNKIDNGLPILWPSTLDAIVRGSLGQERLTMTLLSVFASIAFLLAVVGIYAAVGYTVEQRTGEIGVRMALGAQSRDVLRLVVRQGMTPVLIGLVAGLAATFPMGFFLASQLYEVSPHNPLLLGASAVALALAGFLACLIPALRATRVNPVVALRAE